MHSRLLKCFWVFIMYAVVMVSASFHKIVKNSSYKLYDMISHFFGYVKYFFKKIGRRACLRPKILLFDKLIYPVSLSERIACAV